MFYSLVYLHSVGVCLFLCVRNRAPLASHFRVDAGIVGVWRLQRRERIEWWDGEWLEWRNCASGGYDRAKEILLGPGLDARGYRHLCKEFKGHE
jgi:hypothetical protein